VSSILSASQGLAGAALAEEREGDAAATGLPSSAANTNAAVILDEKLRMRIAP
jgi:hypothetical protein